MSEARSNGSRRLASAVGFAAAVAAASAAIAALIQWHKLKRQAAVTASSIKSSSKQWQLVGRRSELTPGPSGWEALSFQDNKGRDSCVLYSLGRWVAFARSCPHAGIDLLGGDVEDLAGEFGARVVLSCPAHAYLFDAHSGRCLWDPVRTGPPETASLQTYEVEERNGEIWVRETNPPDDVKPLDWDKANADALQLEVVNRVLLKKFPD
eukprot:TRINITY_DN32621_c0_g1_i1.p1 TRINITY_DN32621_c0_g1~~TRINITY_DN32621_c0_g1_i1.p1  ORF type:complete len:209 (-),score=42.24 TRINITY_DN32621_c0_g1_i1:91-717(-)